MLQPATRSPWSEFHTGIGLALVASSLHRIISELLKPQPDWIHLVGGFKLGMGLALAALIVVINWYFGIEHIWGVSGTWATVLLSAVVLMYVTAGVIPCVISFIVGVIIIMREDLPPGRFLRRIWNRLLPKVLNVAESRA